MSRAVNRHVLRAHVRERVLLTRVRTCEIVVMNGAMVEPIPLTEGAEHNLLTDEAFGYLTKAGSSTYKAFTCLDTNPPVQPKGGSIFLYNLGPDHSKWEANKKKIRYVGTIKLLCCC